MTPLSASMAPPKDCGVHGVQVGSKSVSIAAAQRDVVSGQYGGRQSFYRCNIVKELAALDGEGLSTHVDCSSIMILLKQQFVQAG